MLSAIMHWQQSKVGMRKERRDRKERWEKKRCTEEILEVQEREKQRGMTLHAVCVCVCVRACNFDFTEQLA